MPERCPDCDSRDFISYGVTSVICKNCWLTAELDKAEAQVRQLLTVLLGASHALRSYQYGNSAPDLAEEAANAIDAALAAAEEK